MDSTATELAAGQFALARALAHLGRDRERAVDLAERALAGYAATDDADARDRVARWLATVRSPED